METKIVTKLIKHAFSQDEKIIIGSDLSRAIATKRGIESDFEQVHASFKSKIAEEEARIENLSSQLMVGFEMRNKRCRVEYRPKEGRKLYYLEEAPEDADPVHSEEMSQDDYQQDLIAAESKFECKEEIQLFPEAGSDSGILVVGRLAGKWFSALRIQIGGRKIEERLDSEQACVKKRFNAVENAAGRALAWIHDSLGKEVAKGFKDQIAEAILPHKEREE